MFNPKQALQRIRKQKTSQQQDSKIIKHSQYDPPLFPQLSQPEPQTYNSPPYISKSKLTSIPNKSANETLQQRMAKLQSLVFSLNEKLTESNQTITHLKHQNNDLESQLLKLTHQNSKLKTTQKNNSTNNLIQKINSNNLFTQNNRVLSSLSSDKLHIKKAESKVIEDDAFSPQVEDAMEGIKKEPIQNILKRKQHNFRALKNASKQTLAKGQKALRQLANLQKQYGKNYKKPTLIINLQDADFE